MAKESPLSSRMRERGLFYFWTSPALQDLSRKFNHKFNDNFPCTHYDKNHYREAAELPA